ncbi:hypothetical protein [Variovorax sp. 770b2]|uniref:hypothetical protein n=1 Tax=Variovorax sp. 770b2 TaxID=1566271 RepID=UPI000B87881A|nr:hypothetical protein [Variovorax sp. 770b2]
MAKQIIAGRSTPKSSRPTTTTSTTGPTGPTGLPPMPPTGQDAFDLLENKAAQLRSLLWCAYGGNGWFEEAGEEHRSNIVWIAADLALEVEELVQGSVRG